MGEGGGVYMYILHPDWNFFGNVNKIFFERLFHS